VELANLTSPSLAEVIDQAPTGISGSEGRRTSPTGSYAMPISRSHDHQPDTQLPVLIRRAQILVTALSSGLVEQPGEQQQSPGDQWLGTRARYSASSGGWLLPELVDELPDLGLGVAAMPT
jgi:hypothetical protein